MVAQLQADTLLQYTDSAGGVPQLKFGPTFVIIFPKAQISK